MNARVEGPVKGQGRVCDRILRTLPDWFGDPVAVRGYADDAETGQSFVARAGETTVGILTFKFHSKRAAEIVVIGVVPECHRRGIGRALVSAFESHMHHRGVEYVQVKTLDEAAQSNAYRRTRRFYDAMGFVPLEVWPNTWGAGNPCLQMVKHLGPS